MEVPNAYAVYTDNALELNQWLKHAVVNDKKFQEAVTDCDIRLKGKGFVQIGLVFGFGDLFREQCKAMFTYFRECRSCK